MNLVENVQTRSSILNKGNWMEQIVRGDIFVRLWNNFSWERERRIEKTDETAMNYVHLSSSTTDSQVDDGSPVVVLHCIRQNGNSKVCP